MSEVRIAVAILALGAALIAAPSAGAVITVGSSLSAPVDNSIGGDITAFPIAPSGGLTTSPVTGTVVGGGVKQDTSAASPWGTVSLRVVRPVSGGQYQVLSAGPANAVPGGSGTFPLAANLAIAKGDIVAIQATGSLNQATTAGATYLWYLTSSFTPGGPPQTLLPGFTNTELLYNAQIDPSNAFTVGAIRRNKKKGTATLTVNVPNPGELTGSGKGVKVAGAAGAVTSKTVAAPGEVKLTIRAKGKKRRKLNETGKVKVKPTITYTPTGGDPSTQPRKVKLKKR